MHGCMNNVRMQYLAIILCVVVFVGVRVWISFHFLYLCKCELKTSLPTIYYQINPNVTWSTIIKMFDNFISNK